MRDSISKRPNSVDLALGAAIRARRRSLRLSQQVLAARCGVSFQQMQKYENGANRVSFSRLVQIAEALACRVVDLVAALGPHEGEETGEFALLPRLATPGALELLTAYDDLPPQARSPLLKWVQALRNQYGVAAAAADGEPCEAALCPAMEAKKLSA